MTTTAPHITTGRLRHRAMLQKLEQVQDSVGGWETTWVDDRLIWCWIRPLSGTQRLENMRRDNQVSHTIYARFDTNISAENRIKYRNKVYRLEAPWSPDERMEFIQMSATEGVAT